MLVLLSKSSRPLEFIWVLSSRTKGLSMITELERASTTKEFPFDRSIGDNLPLFLSSATGYGSLELRRIFILPSGCRLADSYSFLFRDGGTRSRLEPLSSFWVPTYYKTLMKLSSSFGAILESFFSYVWSRLLEMRQKFPPLLHTFLG